MFTAGWDRGSALYAQTEASTFDQEQEENEKSPGLKNTEKELTTENEVSKADVETAIEVHRTLGGPGADVPAAHGPEARAGGQFRGTTYKEGIRRIVNRFRRNSAHFSYLCDITSLR